jgi:phosphopantetheinyl transferase
MTHDAWNFESLDPLAPTDIKKASVLRSEEVHLWTGPYTERKKRNEILRHIAAGYVGKSLDEMCLSYLPGGKPFFEHEVLHLSLSHTDDQLIMAFAHFAIGVDVEMTNRNVSMEAISRRYFEPSECVALANCSESDRRTMFFRMWVRKEAAVKMTGEGLSEGLRKVRVDPSREGWSVFREEEVLFVKEVIPWPGTLGAIVARCQFSVTVGREF